MKTIVVEGGRRLAGDVFISGAKNAALPIMATALLTSEECVFENIPYIEDIVTMAELLQTLGAEVTIDHNAHRVAIRAAEIRRLDPPLDLAKRMRASFLVTGPLIARLGEMKVPHPGGCALGTRPVNVDVRGFKAMGAVVTEEGDFYVGRTKRLMGAKLYLDYPSHTGTENLLMAACLAEGRTTIKHASTEPEIVNLAECLRTMGARIKGAGSSIIEIDGVDHLHGATHSVIPDRIEAGTFAIAAAITRGDVILHNMSCLDMDPVTHKLRESGIDVEERGTAMRIRSEGSLEAVDVQALPFPGFPTDLQAAFASLMTQATGTSTIFERVYDNRLLYTQELRKMGAEIEVRGQIAKIVGPSKLVGTRLRALDIRCGASLVLAGLAAEGKTEILDAYHLDRGYENLVDKLTSIGGGVAAQF
jgi:UDP-N-acetylglucosamine 1-carboxyvinyltransferase